jgi:hypothetical protein
VTGGRLEPHQRRFLLEEFEVILCEVLEDTEADGNLGPANVRHAASTRSLIDWLRGGEKPGVAVREFLEKRLEAADEILGYSQAVYEHDAFVAAIEELR